MNENNEAKNKEIIDALRNKGITCKSCWWQEGGQCYFGEPEREENGRSKVAASDVCENHTSKRSVLAPLFGDKLSIISEENAGKKDY